MIAGKLHLFPTAIIRYQLALVREAVETLGAVSARG